MAKRLRVTLTISTADEAVQREPLQEAAEHMLHVREALLAGAEMGVLHDYNGNRVGSWEATVTEESDR